MKKEKTLVKAFRLNYGAWQLFDKEFLSLYKDLFIIDRQDRPLFEISPEVFDDNSREQIKHHKTYSIEELKENLSLINNCLGPGVKVSVFFSRYHDTARKYTAIREETQRIFQLKHDLFAKGFTDVKIYYDHLSTDVGSRYWESYVAKPSDLDTLISWKKRLKSREEFSFPLDNLCIYIPEVLSEHEVFRCELLIFMLKSLEKHSHIFFHILFECLGDSVIGAVERVIAETKSNTAVNIFKSLDQCELIQGLKRTISQQRSLFSRIPFIDDLTRFEIKKAVCRQSPRLERSSHQARRPMLNQAHISIHDHDYLDLPGFLARLKKEGPGNLKREKTVLVFLADEIISMSYETYRLTLKAFERGLSLDQYYMLMRRRGIFDIAYYERLIDKLFQDNVLY